MITCLLYAVDYETERKHTKYRRHFKKLTQRLPSVLRTSFLIQSTVDIAHYYSYAVIATGLIVRSALLRNTLTIQF